MPTIDRRGLDICLSFAQTIGRSRTLEEIYEAALFSLDRGLGVQRSSILLFDADGVMRFKAWRGITDAYRQAVEGHTPWTPDTPHAEPVVVADVREDPSLAAFRATFEREGIAAMTFIPLIISGRVIGKFMIYFDAPRTPSAEELTLAKILASEVAFAVERTRAQRAAERNEERLRFALDAARMGTWEWDLRTNAVHWSDNLERIHDLPPGGFDGTVAGYQREIHPQDRARVMDAVRRAVERGAAYDVEYRIVTPAGDIRWVEGSGRVEYGDDGRPLRMTGVCMDITRRKQAEIDRLETAREASRMKDEFLAVLSHELRTPLNAILGWAKLIQHGALEGRRVAEAVDVIERNARLQAQLIEQILDVSRIITGKLQIERAPCIVPQLVQNAVYAVMPAALARGLTVTTEISPDLTPLEGDAGRLQQVLGNVLSNAMKFTPSGGTIVVRCEAAGSRVAIEVSDSGAGIPPEFLPFVFERFRQADASPTRHHGGLGLGLAIARHLVELHGGHISARSDGHNLGTTVRIELPVPMPDAAQSTDAPARTDIPHSGFNGTRVLVVDDEPDARQLLVEIFTHEGAIVREAASARQAVEELAHGRIDLLVADIAMPDVDGYELIRGMRRAEQDVPAIAVTAYARPEDRSRALAAGYDAFLSKPFDPAALLRAASDLAGPAGRITGL